MKVSLRPDQKARLSAVFRQGQDLKVPLLPEFSFFLQPGVQAQLQKDIKRLTNAIKVQIRKEELTVRRENEFAMLESTTVNTVLMFVHLA
jgi:hypothetical protein